MIKWHKAFKAKQGARHKYFSQCQLLILAVSWDMNEVDWEWTCLLMACLGASFIVKWLKEDNIFLKNCYYPLILVL